MAAELVTPTDELTGLPLPIAPVNNPVSPDWHHHWHPRDSAVLKSGGGLALRQSRLQRMDYRTHHLGYHRTYEGPPLPLTPQEQFGAVIMSVAGYMPPEAIDFSAKEPRIVTLSEDQRRHLQESSQLRFTGHWVIKHFIKDYILSQPIDSLNINNVTLDEFLHTNNPERRRELGHNLLSLFTDKATEPIDDLYYQARKRDMLPPGLPGSARRFTKSFLGPVKIRQRFVNNLYSQLGQA